MQSSAYSPQRGHLPVGEPTVSASSGILLMTNFAILAGWVALAMRFFEEFAVVAGTPFVWMEWQSPCEKAQFSTVSGPSRAIS